ncbi:cytochrome P450 [Nocardia cyriacigeorgica]|uniref:cytochrome P450 n=1 Tax=Nocardia cyriacigeorgica TaxID=135487 RepID=UPI0018949F2F|nr:cytochrome P450 [Nocardia cyriacigeorgica]MBF6477112.1 cytochrome P450 [Nocardia cyriacigeorgica]
MSPPRTGRDEAAVLPHPRWRLPVVGDLFTMNVAKPTQTSRRDARRLGPIFERRITNWPMIVVSGADLIAEINDEHHWTKHLGVPLRKLRRVARDGLFTARNDEPAWSAAHNILAPAFTQTAMRSYHQTMAATIGELLDTWGDTHHIADIAEEMNRLTLEIIARTGFGYSFDSFSYTPGQAHPFVEAMLRGLTYINRNANLPPLLQNTLGRRAAGQHRRDIAFMHRTVDDVIAARRTSGTVGQHDDLLDRMLTTTDPDTGEHLDATNIRNQILTFLVAGHETSAGALAFALYELAKNPEVAARARAEVDDHFPGRDRPITSSEDVAKLRYLRRVVDETLRLWPVAPGYFREARHEVTIGDGKYRFQQGDWVFVLTWYAHRDPETWGPDAERFDPDRWAPQRQRELDRRRVYRPFGVGHRACIGRQFANHEVLLTLAHVLHQYEIHIDGDYTLDVAEQITLKPAGLRVRVDRRTDLTTH